MVVLYNYCRQRRSLLVRNRWEGTIHGMGLIAAVTPACRRHKMKIPRLDVGLDELRDSGSILINVYHKPAKSIDIMYKDIHIEMFEDNCKHLEILR